MKYIILLVGVFFCFVLGYLVEPKLRGSLMDEGKNSEPEPVVEGVPEPTPQPTPDPEPEVASVVEPEPEPVPEPEPEPESQSPGDEQPVLAAPTDNEIRQIMHQSIQQAEINHFTISQVTQWKDFGDEQIDGTTYQFGLIDYSEETIFGKREFEAKALIRDGKVEKWIWTSNGMRIP